MQNLKIEWKAIIQVSFSAEDWGFKPTQDTRFDAALAGDLNRKFEGLVNAGLKRDTVQTTVRLIIVDAAKTSNTEINLSKAIGHLVTVLDEIYRDPT